MSHDHWLEPPEECGECGASNGCDCFEADEDDRRSHELKDERLWV